MKKKSVLILIFLLIIAMSCTKKDVKENLSTTNIEIPSSSQKNKPNIILFVVDDLGTNDAGCYGNTLIKTPGIDALATQGTRFTNAFCTTPSCSASRSVILTGKQNHANGQYGHSHFEFHFSAFKNIKSLPVILDSVGYRTMRVGKFHIAPASVFHFNDYHPKKADYPDEVWKPFSESPKYPFANTRPPEVLAEDMRNFIAQKESPFFLYFNTFEPHAPYNREGSDIINSKDVIVPEHLPDVPSVREELAKYYMSAQRADKALLKLTQILKETEQWENTIILFTSDNGRPFPGAKINLYDPGIKLPFVFRNPHQNKQNIVSDAMVSFTDITPTLLDFAGVDISKYNFHGHSFKSQLNKEKSIGFDTVYASHTFHEIQMYYPMRMIRDRQYKFIWNLESQKPFHLGVGTDAFINLIKNNNLTHIGKRKVKDYLQRPKFELYDLKNDPHEINNLADDSAYDKLVKTYKSKLNTFQNTTDDPWKIYQNYEKLEKLVLNNKYE